MTASPPSQLIVGPPQHGVVQYATKIANMIAHADPRSGAVDVISIDELFRHFDTHGAPARAHLHLTDRLLGTSAITAAERFEQLAAQTSVSITLHDLPQPSDGSGFARRIEGYRRMLAAATAAVCNSRHELRLVEEHLGLDSSHIAVIPLPVGRAPALPQRPRPEAHGVAILGFIYPGKGHAEVIDVVAAMKSDARPPVIALGGPSLGHESDVEDLQQAAARRGVHFDITGYLSDADLLDRCRASAVPVVALQHVSASGSTATWIESGRRPLVPDSRYAREIAELRPGTVTLYESGMLGAAVSAALEHPESTWLSPGTDTGPHLADTAEVYLRWWEQITW